MAQRIVRAKRTLSDKQVPFEVPRGDDRLERLASVLEVIYLVFNEGYAATAGDDWLRPALCDEALRLGRILAGLAPREPEVHRSEEHTSELQSLMRNSYAVFCLKKKKDNTKATDDQTTRTPNV